MIKTELENEILSAMDQCDRNLSILNDSDAMPEERERARKNLMTHAHILIDKTMMLAKVTCKHIEECEEYGCDLHRFVKKGRNIIEYARDMGKIIGQRIIEDKQHDRAAVAGPDAVSKGHGFHDLLDARVVFEQSVGIVRMAMKKLGEGVLERTLREHGIHHREPIVGHPLLLRAEGVVYITVPRAADTQFAWDEVQSALDIARMEGLHLHLHCSPGDVPNMEASIIRKMPSATITNSEYELKKALTERSAEAARVAEARHTFEAALIKGGLNPQAIPEIPGAYLTKNGIYMRVIKETEEARQLIEEAFRRAQKSKVHLHINSFE